MTVRLETVLGWVLAIAGWLACLLFNIAIPMVDLPPSLGLAGRQIPSVILTFPGLALGAAWVLLSRIPKPQTTSKAAAAAEPPPRVLPEGVPAMLLILMVGGLVFAVCGDHAARELGSVRAALLVVFGTLTIVIAVFALEALRREGGFGLITAWAGFGGALGGWQVTSLAVMLPLVVASAAVTITVALYDGVRPPPAVDPAAAHAKTTSTSAGAAK